MNESSSAQDRSLQISAPPVINLNLAAIPWFSHVVRCNPFYLLSALLLVYGLYRVSIDPHFLHTDTAQVLFNFGAIELYEAMLAVTALALARRRMTYDSLLLFWLENLLVVIPFMLVSHAVFLGPSLAWSICALALLFGALRFAAFQRWFAQVSLAPGLLALGGLALLVNVALPLTFRHGIETDNELWTVRSQYCWLVLLPVLLTLGNFLPRPAAVNPRESRKPSGSGKGFGILLYGLWMAGTAMHLYTIGYVDEQKFTAGDLSVLVWAAAWLFCNRITDFLPAFRFKDKLLVLAPAATSLALFAGRSETFLCLNLLNALILAVIFGVTRVRIAAGLAALSALAALLAIPPQTAALVLPGYSRSQLGILVLALAGFGMALRMRDAKWGILGAISGAILAAATFWNSDLAGHAAMQSGCVFFLLHALRWQGPQERGTNAMLSIAAMGWVLDSLWLLEPSGRPGGYIPFAAVGIVVGVMGVAKLLWNRHCWFTIIATLCVLLTRPGVEIALWAERTPAGLLALIASFGLFALGTLFAVWRSRSRAAREI